MILIYFILLSLSSYVSVFTTALPYTIIFEAFWYKKTRVCFETNKNLHKKFIIFYTIIGRQNMFFFCLYMFKKINIIKLYLKI